MKNELLWVKDALATKDIVSALTYYRVENNTIRATNGRLTACHPFPDRQSYVVEGRTFEALLGRMPSPPLAAEIGETTITFRSGRLRGSIAMLDSSLWNCPVPGDSWRGIPDGLLDGLRELRPFLSDNASQIWATAIYAGPEGLFATNNVMMASSPVPVEVPVLIPGWLVDFILYRKEGLVEWQITDQYVAFRWENGAWAHSLLIDAEFPIERADTLIQEMVEPDEEIHPDWREAFGNVSALSEEEIRLYPDRMTGGRKHLEVVEEVGTKPPTGGQPFSCFHPKFIAIMLTCATHWAPWIWPAPVPFKGERVRGILVGRIP